MLFPCVPNQECHPDIDQLLVSRVDTTTHPSIYEVTYPPNRFMESLSQSVTGPCLKLVGTRQTNRLSDIIAYSSSLLNSQCQDILNHLFGQTNIACSWVISKSQCCSSHPKSPPQPDLMAPLPISQFF